MKPVKPGTRHRQVFEPDAGHFASSAGNAGVDVVATTALILFFEETANNLVLPFFDHGEVAVGTHVNVDHLAPAFAGRPIVVEAELTRVEGRRLEFNLQATQDGQCIMQGEHHRALMPRERFSATEAPAAAPGRIEFWFDFHSPWCYFASHRIGAIAARHGLELRWMPVHLARLSEAVDGRRPLEANDHFVAWYRQDQADTAERYGLAFSQHPDYPLRPSRALRVAIYAADRELAEPFVRRVMAGYWSGGRDISDIEWLGHVAGECGLDPSQAAAAATDPDFKARLNHQLDLALERRLFGLPSVVRDGKIYFGNDRLDLLEWHLTSG